MRGYVEESEEVKAARKLDQAARSFAAGVLNGTTSEALRERLQDAALVYARAYADAYVPTPAKGRFTKRKVWHFVRGKRDMAQTALDCVPADNKLEMARKMGRRDAYDSLLGDIEENVIEGDDRSPRDSTKKKGA